MDEQNGVYLFSEKLFSHRKKEILIHNTTWVNLENNMLSERIQKIKGYILYDSINIKCTHSKIHGDRK